MTRRATGTGGNGDPWTAEETVFFWGGPLLNFAPTPGLLLPVGYHGHRGSERVPVKTVEHWYEASSRRAFDAILAVLTPAGAKRAGRRAELRPDWEQVMFDVMLRGRFAREPYRSALMLTYPRPLARGQPERLRLGRARRRRRLRRPQFARPGLMQVRDELVADVSARRLAASAT